MRLVRPLISIYRKLPIKPFRGTLGKLYRKYQFLNRNKVVIATRDGIKYELNLNELIDSSIYYDGCFEPKTVAVINKYVKRGMTVLDIGANVGCHTLRLAKLVGQDGKVIAFEPLTVVFTKLKCNLELNSFSNVTLEKIALSNENRDNQAVHFYANWPLYSDSHNELHPVHCGRPTEEMINFVTLDDYVQSKEIKKIDFIKLDVDGHEYKVIQGGINSIKTFKPIMIIEFCRYTLMEFNDSLEDLIDLLTSIGYYFYSVENFQQYDSKEALLNTVPPDVAINVLCQLKSNSELEILEG